MLPIYNKSIYKNRLDGWKLLMNICTEKDRCTVKYLFYYTYYNFINNYYIIRILYIYIYLDFI